MQPKTKSLHFGFSYTYYITDYSEAVLKILTLTIFIDITKILHYSLHKLKL